MEPSGSVDDLLKRIGQLRQILGVQQHNNNAPNIIASSQGARKPAAAQTQQQPSRQSLKLPLSGLDHPQDDHECCSSARSPVSAPDEQVVALLNDVTFVRVAVDVVEWLQPPALFLTPKFKNPATQGRLFLEYQFPTTKGEEFATLKKRISVPAKTLLPLVGQFNHRRVALLNVTAGLLDKWSTSSLWFRLFYETPREGPGTEKKLHQLGRCSVRLSQLLAPPFLVEADLPLESTERCQGTLKVSVQLGSRHGGFAERLQAHMRQYGVKPKPRPRHNNSKKTQEQAEPVTPESPREPPVGNGVTQQQQQFPPTQWAVHTTTTSESDGPAVMPTNQNRHNVAPNSNGRPKQNHTHLEPNLPSSPPAILPQQFPEGLMPRIADWYQPSSAARASRPAPAPRPYLDVDDTFNGSLTDYTLTEQPEPTSQRESVAGRRNKVAERLKRTGSQGLTASDRLLLLTVHSATDLPLVKGTRGQPVRPNTYVSYRADDDQLRVSEVRLNCCQPQWHWRTTIHVPANRKNMVLKLWHTSDGARGQRDRVLGFVCLDLVAHRLPLNGQFDLVDLSQSSTGRVHISLCDANGALPEQQQGDEALHHTEPKSIDDQHNSRPQQPLSNGHRECSSSSSSCEESEPLAASLMSVAESITKPARIGPPPLMDRSQNTSLAFERAEQQATPRTKSPLYDEYLDSISAEFLQQKLRENLDDLDRLMSRLN